MSCVRIATISGEPEAKCARTIDGECWEAVECPHYKRHKYNPKNCDCDCPDEDRTLDNLWERSWTDIGRHIILEEEE